MSNILDQLLVEDIARYCPQNFLNFHKCISQNHANPQNCAPQQIELSKCIKSEVPSLQKVMTNCGHLLKEYETCLKTNIAEQGKCLPLLGQVRDCASESIDLSKNTMNNLNPGK
ncbi:hypothetical protein WICANDRAFT_25266 [Wickerhamomyces anomalus NRRL Y-366-8]|uniref:IMS import disulfide relay-system CHCH-CHCH-like Cx9C domain-containing protein n=1 Tax=Wickerhamomyces anomalus (strain ATCC 58044 / CBS 1984 / NCYC 433 / NRRL Y-366-8) TaxID=683960 RepID=A0A1E3P8Q1_WICAA|nr:uncharacterized protein WICANDRAFT_25266 [Wickerhamomyces anomalus NRRL Y-366-8]ODQ61594.1 hypothetical protein WICANDRAFT_25266 [Wickerhamomyces anomalus NRRL Y-366-8]